MIPLSGTFTEKGIVLEIPVFPALSVAKTYRVYPVLFPMLQVYVVVHEVCHDAYGMPFKFMYRVYPEIFASIHDQLKTTVLLQVTVDPLLGTYAPVTIGLVTSIVKVIHVVFPAMS